MNINRHNYESFFLLYTDNELDAAGRKAVEDFVQQNPDLERELALLQQAVFPPDEEVVFAGREGLFKSEDPGIHAGNYEAFFLSYADDELSTDEKRMVEAFVYHHPQYQGELELLQAVRMTPDTAVVFNDRQSLYRREKDDDKVVPFRWWRIAAAAAVLLFLGLWWVNREKTAVPPEIARELPRQAPAAKAPDTAQQATEGLQPAGTAPETPIARTDDKGEGSTPVNPVQREPQHRDLATDAGNRDRRPTAQDRKDRQPIAQAAPPDQVDIAGNDRVVDPAQLPDRPRAAHGSIGVNARPGLIAQAVKIDRPDIYYTSNTIDPNDDSNKDQVEVLNTSVKKSALRGFLRKASRVIAKKTGSGDDDDDNQKHILIGGFAIAVK